ncbi:MAG TPA: 2-succinyl-5-enolpyruvyl-6-hydroxy-3-cyclohexene-1-carboxylic-acid synthase, partial [Pseudobdellovibrionaceae bacterium]|nr:2-succinyl-5-enolpyruvyl-6-hydroxy-3-cyclohexene-1-carboxylic-acid synthase [Pseudobdellovibrionaceae bacterium]
TYGVQDLVFCTGARNTPLLYGLDQFSNFKKFFIFEERSAAFFALGRCQNSNLPVAIITTSGTAAAELLPATIEAHYAGAPLILISADRPKDFRGTGAPQSIEQVNLFSNYVECVLDVDGKNTETSLEDLFSFKNWSQKMPLHINICFTEPLLDKTAPLSKVEEQNSDLKYISDLKQDYSLNPSLASKLLTDFIHYKNPLILVSSLKSQDHNLVLNFLKNTTSPLYIESSSGLKNHKDLKERTIISGEKHAKEWIQKQGHGLLRLGGIPTTRLWRDLEDQFKHLEILSISSLSFLGTTRKHPVLPLKILESYPAAQLELKNFDLEFKKKDLERWNKIKELLKEFPQSEPSLIHQLSNRVQTDLLYLGNSLPIREWDQFSDPQWNPSQVFSNRGANGIDGQLSSFLGAASLNPSHKSWGVFGDLTTLYDLSSPFILSQIQKINFTFVIINNQGGKIFQRLFHREDILNRHEIEFKNWADMWNLSYFKITSLQEFENFNDSQVLEIAPNEKQTLAFWQKYDQL